MWGVPDTRVRSVQTEGARAKIVFNLCGETALRRARAPAASRRSGLYRERSARHEFRSSHKFSTVCGELIHSAHGE
jgi:hypothetical protein